MLLVGSILPAGAGAQLWQLAGAAPADIELNTTAGAAGIVAELPANNLFKLVLADVGQPLFAAGSIDNVNNIFTIVTISDKTGAIQFVDNVAQVGLSIDFDGNILNPDVLLTASVVNNLTQQQLRADYIEQRVTVLGIDAIKTQLNGNYFSVRDGGSAPVFQVRKDGQLETNQTAASVAVRVKVAELPIYDQTGALVGYIDINT
jgi:hypothetical protein